MPKVIIKFNNLKQEQERVKSALNNLEFYKKNNYKIALPAGIGNLSEKKVEKIVKAEYDPDKYQEKIKALSSDWKKIEADFFVKAENVLKLKPLPKYECFITKYGTGGSYNPPNLVIMNINSQNFGVYIIPHEIIHLMIHELIEKYKINHWTKERIVDLYMKKIFYDYIMQGLRFEKELADRIDKIFEENFDKGQEAVISKL